MRLPPALALTAAALLAAGTAASAGTSPLAPYQLVRSLQLLQDRIADGDHAALPMQGRLLGMIDQRMRDTTSLEFADPRNFNALMVYGMSGGNPATVDKVMQRLHLTDAERTIGTGVVHFLSGRPQQARQRLAAIDPLTQPLELGASVALVKGSVTGSDSPAEALKLFDQARLLGPGTLVEEAALRRSLPIAIANRDVKRFLATASDYVRAYLRSPYAAEFAQTFVGGIISLQPDIDMAAVDAIVAGMTPEQRDAIYLRLARKGAIDDVPSLSALATRKVLNEDEDAGADPRALLYASMAALKTEPVEAIAGRLAGLDRNRLSASDRELLDALRSVLDAVLAKPEPVRAEAAPDAVESQMELKAEPAAPEAAPEHEPDGGAAHAAANPPPAAPAGGNETAAAEASDARVVAARKNLADIDQMLAETSGE